MRHCTFPTWAVVLSLPLHVFFPTSADLHCFLISSVFRLKWDVDTIILKNKKQAPFTHCWSVIIFNSKCISAVTLQGSSLPVADCSLLLCCLACTNRVWALLSLSSMCARISVGKLQISLSVSASEFFIHNLKHWLFWSLTHKNTLPLLRCFMLQPKLKTKVMPVWQN